jgi:hypothetical protein
MTPTGDVIPRLPATITPPKQSVTATVALTPPESSINDDNNRENENEN